MFKEEKIIERKTCKHCNSEFNITDKDLEFYEKISPVFNGKKYLIPSPTLCPNCRQQRRLSWRNERKLYKRKCDATGKEIVSIYSPDKPYIVFSRKYWLSDNWNELNYGRDFDFDKTFFEQFKELFLKVPRPALHQDGVMENSEYTNEMSNSKDSYLIFDGDSNDRVLYSNWIGSSFNTLDSAYSFGLKNSYECINCYNSDSLFFSKNCDSCNFSYFLNDCISCEFCIGCSGLRNAKYYIENKQVSKEDFLKIENELKIGAYKNTFSNFLNTFPKKDRIVINSENVFGNNIVNSSNIYYGFDVFNCQNSKYIFDIWDSNNVMDYYEGRNSPSFSYEGETGGGCFMCGFISRCTSCKNTYYSNFLQDCEHCFGCIGMKKKKYCILNKEYSKEEYESLVPKIIEHMMTSLKSPLSKEGEIEWGEFFPSSISPFGYNETVAQEYFPLISREVALQHLYNWSDYEPPFPKVEKIIKASILPDDISKIPDDILNWAIECEVTKKPFKIIKQELDFYRKHNLPIPKRHPDQRHLDRLSLRNPRKLFDRKCDKCGKEIKTTYSPDRKEIVYCGICYEKEIY